MNTWVHIRPFEYKFSTGIDEYYLFESSTAGHLIKQISLGKYIEDKVPSLKHFMIEENNGYKHSIPSLAALVRSKRLLQRFWSCDEPQLKFCRANWLWYNCVEWMIFVLIFASYLQAWIQNQSRRMGWVLQVSFGSRNIRTNIRIHQGCNWWKYWSESLHSNRTAGSSWCSSWSILSFPPIQFTKFLN